MKYRIRIALTLFYLAVALSGLLLYDGLLPIGYVTYEFGEDVIPFYSNSNVSFNVTLDKFATYSTLTEAKGDLAGDAAPILRVYWDGILSGEHNVTTNYDWYNTTKNLTPGTHILTFSFENDYLNPPEDRNLYVRNFEIEGIDNLTSQIQVSYSNEVKTTELDYGINEKDRPYYHSVHEIQERIVNTSAKYVRIWIRYYNDENENLVPFNQSGTGDYNYSNLDRNVHSILNNLSAIPYMSFEGCPKEYSVNYSSNGSTAPSDSAACAQYMANVVQHYQTLCTNGTWAECDFEEWYWGIYNEPDCFDGWANWTTNKAYISFFNQAYNAIKENVSTAKVGGWDSCGLEPNDHRLTLFLNESTPDFFSWHNYNLQTKRISFSIPNNIHDTIQTAGLDIPIILGEHNLNSTWETGTDSKIHNEFGGMWMASALGWLVKSQTDLEFFFEGTGHNSTFGFGLWSSLESEDYATTPAYESRRLFTTYIPTGSTIVSSNSYDPLLEVLAVKNPDKILLLINKRNQSVVANVSVDSIVGDILKLNDGSLISHTGRNLRLTLAPYETAFLQLNDSYRSINVPEGLQVFVGDEEYEGEVYEEERNVTIYKDGFKAVSFSYDFNAQVIDLSDIQILVDDYPDGSISVSNLEIPKTLYVPRQRNTSLCIKDSQNVSISEACNGTGEVLVNCTGNCSIEGDYYAIRNMMHSAAKEFGCYESWSCAEWMDCIGGSMSRDCEDINQCGTEFNKPTTNQSCNCTESWECTTWSDCDGEQSRDCVDTHHCGTEFAKPDEVRVCSQGSGNPTGGSPMNFKGGSPSFFKGGVLKGSPLVEDTPPVIPSEINESGTNESREQQDTGAYLLKKEVPESIAGKVQKPDKISTSTFRFSKRYAIATAIFILVVLSSIVLIEKTDYDLGEEKTRELHGFMNSAVIRGYDAKDIRRAMRKAGWKWHVAYIETKRFFR